MAKKKRNSKEDKELKRLAELYDDCDERFAFIAGYTSGGAAYGLQWEEVGIDPELPFEEKVRRYASGEYEMPKQDDFEDENVPLQIEVLPWDFTVCKEKDYSGVNPEEDFCFIGKTDGEKSLVCLTDRVPANTTEREDGWRGLRVAGTLDFSLVGILADISGILASCGVSIFALSTFDTDYVLVKKKNLRIAVDALVYEGFDVIEA